MPAFLTPQGPVNPLLLFILFLLMAGLAFSHGRLKRKVNTQSTESGAMLARYEHVMEEQAKHIERLDKLLKTKEAELESVRVQSDQLLLNVLPLPIAQRLKDGEKMIAENFQEVTVLFADIVSFTQITASIPPPEVVEFLNRVFSLFDIFSEQHAVEKIKTIGDAYMVVGGVPEPRVDHAEAVADMAIEIQQTIALLSYTMEIPVRVRIGIHTGPAIAGIIGKNKFSYDLWGDTVNTASRLEAYGEPGKIHVSEAIHTKLKDSYVFEERGVIDVKGKGPMRTFFLLGKLDEHGRPREVWNDGFESQPE